MVTVFYLLFQKFGVIGGLDFQWYLRLNTVVIWWYCFMNIFFYGSRKISEKVTAGQLDADLLLPKDLLLRLLLNGINITAYGDLLYWILLLFFVKGVTILFLCKLVFVSIFAGLVFTGFMLIFESLGFRIWSSRELSKAIFEAVLWPSHYPQGIFQYKFLQLLFVSLIPIFFISYLPYNMVTSEFSIQNILMLMAASEFFFGLWYILFYKWLKRYESGNTININM